MVLLVSISLVADHVEDPAHVVIATETDRGLFVNALVASGYTVLAINPMSTSRYRERHSTSGAKSDPGDAKVLADFARTDGHIHRSVAGDSELGEAIKVLARAHQALIWSRQRHANQLRSTLREFYPGALAAFDELAGRDVNGPFSFLGQPGRLPPLQKRRPLRSSLAGGSLHPPKSTACECSSLLADAAMPARPTAGPVGVPARCAESIFRTRADRRRRYVSPPPRSTH